MRLSLRRREGTARAAAAWLPCGASLLGVALGLASTAARAADLPVPASPPPVFTTLNWTGFYAGVQAGYESGHDHLVELVTATGVPTGSVYDYHPDGFIGGVHAGFDMQVHSIVLGAVADFEGTTLRGSFVDPTGIGRGHDTIPWQGSVRGRVGYAFGNMLAYATGGFAYAELRNTYVYVPVITRETFSNVVTGWTVGGGLDYALTGNWVVSAEYRHTQYDRLLNISTVAFPGLSGAQDLRSDSVRMGVSYRF